MPDSKENRPLTEEEKQKIYEVIYYLMNEDDLDPIVVIREKFDGNEDAYLRRMAKYYGIPRYRD